MTALAPRSFLTCLDGGERLTEVAPLVSTDPGHRQASVLAVPDRTFQVMEGFGGAFTEAAALTWQSLDDERRAALLRDCFCPTEGHGYTLCRVPMGSCDFALGNYSHVDTPGDYALESFSIARDRQAIIPFIRAAMAVRGSEIKLLASPWSPPAWMKTTGRMNDGGALRPDCRATWAQCFVRFIQAYAAEGIPIWGVSVQNEPEATQRWDSCLYTGEEERDFIRDHLGPALHRAGLADVRIVAWDHNRDRLVERAAAVYRDRAAARFVWGTGFHWYGADHFDHVQQVHDAWPDKHLLFTEGCQEGGPHHGQWEVGERYARSMIADINRWTVGWIDWNLCLDMQGGPNHVGNFCSAPLLVDAAAGLVHRQSAYFYIGHFARFAKPGARRILCAADDARLEATGFLNPDGSLAIVVLNRTGEGRDFVLRLGDTDWRAHLPPRAIATYALAATPISSG